MSEVMTEKGLSIGVGLNWIVTLVIATFTTEIINVFADNKDEGSGRLFCLCGGFMVLSGLFCVFFVKETKGLDDKEVAMLYVNGDTTYSPLNSLEK